MYNYAKLAFEGLTSTQEEKGVHPCTQVCTPVQYIMTKIAREGSSHDYEY